MGTIKVTVANGYLNIVEEFICNNIDTSDKEEMEYCAEECCAKFLDMHHDIINAKCPDLDMETIEENCFYMIEEVVDDV